jgi:hypothetical protein
LQQRPGLQADDDRGGDGCADQEIPYKLPGPGGRGLRCA